MTNPNRLGAKLAAASLIALAAGCAAPGTSGPRSASIFGGKVDTANIGLATKAQLALASNDIATAIPLAERAVERSPNDAGFRALLGNCYLAAGRFASAEAAYRDSLSLVANQPQLILKLALVQTAQGKSTDAIRLLAEAQSVIDPADLGLALALAGDSQSALQVLDPAARTVGADSRTRQNLALAHALAGNWEQARLIAAQDIPAGEVDARITQWMALAKPTRVSDQVAAFIGVQPAAGDPGQPVRLAFNKADTNTRQAAAEPAPAPVPVAEPVAIAAVESAPEPVAIAAVEPVLAPAAGPAASVTIDLPPVSHAAPAPVRVAASPIRQPRPALSPAAVRLSNSVASLRRNASMPVRNGASRAVVQLGAYKSSNSVAIAWNKVAGKHAKLRSYTPVSARFAGAKGTVYRLSVRGFASESEALGLCNGLKRAGSNCFVRAVSGDAPVRFAAR
ncbi:MAG: tetratricopeptide repeat protein [Sphingomicrobium sp.]